MVRENIENLRGSSRTQHGNEVTTTVRDPKYTTKTEQTLGGFYNTDGTPNAAAQADYDQQRRAIATAYGVDPNTGHVEHKYLTDILGVDPDVMRRKRAEEEALNRRKQRESGLYNALSVIGDMITTAGGGNVWKRDPNKHAAAAHDANLALQREQLAEDIDNANKLRGTERAYAAAVQKLHDSIGKSYSTKVSNTIEQGGSTVATKQRGDDVTTNSREVLNPNKNRININGKYYEATTPVSVRDPQTGEYVHFNAPTRDALDYARKYLGELTSYYNNYKGDKDDPTYKSIQKVLIDSRVLDKKGRKLSSGPTEDDALRALSMGYVYRLNNSALDKELQRLYSMDPDKKGKKLKLQFGDGGFNPDSTSTEGGL